MDIAIDVRVIAATNRDLMTLVREGRFRADLYARLAQWSIALPPLRAHREDLDALSRVLLSRCDGVGRRIHVDLAEQLLLHDWPLNVRGLLNVLSVAVVACEPDGPLCLAPEVGAALDATRSLVPLAPDDAEQAQAHPTHPAASAPRATPPADAPGRSQLEAALVRSEGRVAAAARELGLNRTAMYRLLWSNDLDPDSFRPTR